MSKISLYDLLSQAQGKEKVNMQQLYGDVLVRKSIQKRIPLSVQFELLPLCNFSCKFCYVRMTAQEVEQSGNHIMRFADWKEQIDGARSLGASSMTFTGGECTIHPDFIDIYEYAYNCGMQVCMISNGSNITEEMLDLFRRCPPSKIFITLYGMSEKAYADTCGNGAAFEKVIQNIQTLKALGIHLILNYTAGKENFADMEAVLAFGREQKMEVIPTNALIHKDKCTADTLQNELVDYYDYLKLEHQHLSILRGKSFEAFEESYFSSFFEPIPAEEGGLQCNAGRCTYTVNWLGKMKPCANFDFPQYDPRKIGFESAWKKIVEWADSVPLLEECESCIFQPKCRRCAAMHYGDMGEFNRVSPRFCFKKLFPQQAETMLAKYEQLKAEGKIESLNRWNNGGEEQTDPIGRCP
ncbi:MAG: radical SAM protein [Clostridia bacterium]|nr:radical SAM protein [Clostridia bacterium]